MIKEIISEVYGVDLTKKTRDRRFVEARQAFCYFCRNYTRMGVVEIGNEIGLKHSTVSYGSQAYADLLMYPEVRTLAEQVESKIKSYGMQDVINK